MSSHIGAKRLADTCERLENEARQGNVEGLVAHLARLRNELLDVLARIKELKSTETPPPTAMDA